MKRAWYAVAILVLVLACGPDPEPPSRPPASPDRLSALSQHPATLPHLTPSPPAEEWMLGCFDVFGQSRTRRVPTRVKLTLTAAPRERDMRTYYRAESLNSTQDHEPWWWLVLPQSQLQVSLTNGFSGHTLLLQRDGSDLVGTSRAVSDVPSGDEALPVRLRRVPCP
jgi:hypothetical protein